MGIARQKTAARDLVAVQERRRSPRSHRSVSEYRVSVVIPTKNEAANLPYVLPHIPRWVHEVIVVDGGSVDGAPDAARRFWPGARVVPQLGRGKGAALRMGFEVATGEIIVLLDVDGSTNPAEIPSFVRTLLSGAEFVKGSRFVQRGGTSDMSWYRHLGNAAFVHLVRALFRGRYSDLCYGYNAFWTRVLPVLQLDSNGFEIETVMNVRALRVGLRVAEVPSFEAERIHGTSNLRTIPDGWRVLQAIGREYAVSPIRRPTGLKNGALAHEIPAILEPVEPTDENASESV